MKHWRPQQEAVPLPPMQRQWTSAASYAGELRRTWPAGATAGLLLIAAGCVGMGVLLYHLAGPKDVFGP